MKIVKNIKSAISGIKEEIKNAIDEKNKVTIAKAVAFAKKNKDTCVLVLDKNSDDVVIAYKDRYIATRMTETNVMNFNSKLGIVSSILNGDKDEKDTLKGVEFVKEVVGEFLWQINEHNRYDKEYKEKLENGYSESFQTFMKEKRSEKQLSTKNKEKNEES